MRVVEELVSLFLAEIKQGLLIIEVFPVCSGLEALEEFKPFSFKAAQGAILQINS